MSRVRVATLADAGGIAVIYAPIVETTWISFEVEPPDTTEIARRMGVAQHRWPWLVSEDEHGISGYAYATEHRARAAYRWSADVSIYVAGRARRAGIARRLYRALFAVLIEAGYVNAFAGVTLPNDASLALHRSLDFTPVGTYCNVGYKLGAWHDVMWLQRVLRMPTAEPFEPLAFAEIAGRLAAILPHEGVHDEA